MQDEILSVQPTGFAEVLSGLPERERHHMISGMRWTLWLSMLSVPLGYATTVILARIGPAAIGTYGVLMVYISVVACLMYVGGDAVLIKFIPELPPEQQLRFVTAYTVIVMACLLPWFAVATVRPQLLHFLFGESNQTSLQLLLIYLSPFFVIYSITAATLNGMMEMKWSQIMKRVVTVGSFLTFVTLFLFARDYLRAHYANLIWEIYFGLTALAAGLGLVKVVQTHPIRSARSFLGFHLPRRFWNYTLSLQAVSALGMLSSRLDYILVLYFGGLVVLGKYVALRTISNAIGLIAAFFVDTLLPTMTNLLARKDISAAGEALHLYLRVLFAISFAVSSGLFLTSSFLIRMFGPAYGDLQAVLVCMILFSALQNCTSIAGILLTASGEQQYVLVVLPLQIGGFCLLFWLLWPSLGVMGVVIGLGITQVLGQILLFYFVKQVVPIRFTIGKHYVLYALLVMACGFVAYFLPALGIAKDVLLYASALALFYFFSGYSLMECKQLVHCFISLPRSQA
jgi:O-antigen/teichoic acid export membrane protein